jgi:ferredoxin
MKQRQRQYSRPPPKRPPVTTLICDCNQTQQLDLKTLGRALPDPLQAHTHLCRREAGAFVQALGTGQPLTVTCTQERALFEQLAESASADKGGAAWAPIKFVNIRETAGWSRQGQQAAPKMAALIAAAQSPAPEPVPTVSYRSSGRVLIIGPIDQAERAAALLGDLPVTLLSTGPGAAGAQPGRPYPVLAGRIESLRGWLGDFKLKLRRDNPIDLDLCTRCNACVVACPEQAIGLDYQIDLARCQGHRDCVQACGTLAAIDFQREPDVEELEFDLVLDLGATPVLSMHALPQGYVATARQPLVDAIVALRAWVGEFEKPRFFQYRQKLCAHTRNEKTGCQACIDICSAEAISSDRQRQQIAVNPHLCVGCGACTTVCPTGALSYAYPRSTDLGPKLQTALRTYAQAGGTEAVLLLHNPQSGRAAIEELGRAAQLGLARGLPARVIPMEVWHSASVGLDLWLSLLALGARQIMVLCTDDDAPAYVQALGEQAELAAQLMQGLGYSGRGVRVLRAHGGLDLEAEIESALDHGSATPLPQATFAFTGDKRSQLELALAHWLAHAPALSQPEPPGVIALGSGSPWGTVEVNTDACTLCMSCVGACPAGALADNPDSPQLRLTEKNCVQCGLCVKTCPEKALTLIPRLSLTRERGQQRVLHQSQPYACIRCGKAFGTVGAVQAMLQRLQGHPMFQGTALERIKMCGDCRVIDIYGSDDEQTIQ